MKKNCLNWFLSAAFLFLLGSCANKVKPGQEPEVKEKFTFAYFTDVHLNIWNARTISSRRWMP